MRIIQSQNPRPLNLLAIGANGLVAAASNVFQSPGDVEVWSITSGHLIEAYHSTLGFAALAYDATGDHMIFSVPESRFTVINVKTRAGHDWPVKFIYTQFALFPDATRLLVASSSSTSDIVECWAIKPDWSFERLWGEPPRPRHSYHAPAVSPNGTKVVTAERYEGNDGRPRQDVSFRDASTGKVRVTISLDAASPVRQLAFTADGTKLLVRTDSRTVHLFDAATGSPAGALVHPRQSHVMGIAVHPRGPVACARTNGTVTLWDAEKREQMRTLDWKAGKLVSVAFGPDGALGAAGTEDGQVIVWDVDL
jgi:WD40 repeat protein